MSSIPFRVTHRRTTTSGRVPSIESLLTGEIYLQLADELIYFKNASETKLVTVITDASGNGLNKLKFSGASAGQIPYWDGFKFAPASTGNFITSSQTGVFITSSQTGIFATSFNSGAFVTTGQTGQFVTLSQTGAFGGVVSINTGAFVTTGQTGAFASSFNSGQFVLTGQTGNFVTIDQTGNFGAAGYVATGATGSFVTNDRTGNFVTTAQTGIYAPAAGTGNFVTTAQTGIYAAAADTGNFVTTAQTGIYAAAANTGNFVTTAQTGIYAAAAGTGNFVTTAQTGIYASLDGSNYLKQSQIPNITGDVCINAGSNNSVVYKIQGYPVSNQQPVIGQTLQFDGSTWSPGSIPAGGNGGGGLVYYFNDAIAADLPTGNLPASLSGTFELGRSGTLSQYSITASSLSEVSYDPIVGFVSDILDPNVSSIPAGLFDFNIWASSNSTTQTILQLKVYKYDGDTTTATLLATSDDVYTYDGLVVSQYTLSVVLPQTSLSSTDRLFILISAKGLANNKDITLYFGGNTPSHVHTTIPSIGGSGLVKVINGVMQNPASQIVDSDVSASAAIAGTKIQAGYFALANATGSFITNAQTGVFTANANTGNFLTTSQTGIFASTSQITGYFPASGCSAIVGGSGNFVCTGSCNTVILGGSFLTGRLSNTVYTRDLCACGNIVTAGNITASGSVFICGSALCSAGFNLLLNSQVSNITSSSYSTTIGGIVHNINASSCSIIAGGCYHQINGAGGSAILGGATHTVYNSNYSAAIVGESNTVWLSSRSVVLGGGANTICCAQSSSILNGTGNFISGASSSIRNVAIIGSGITVTGTVSNTLYVNNICTFGGKYFGDGSALTGLATGSFITTDQTGAFGAAGYVTTQSTGILVGTGQTGNFVTANQTGNFVTANQTGIFALAANTGYFITTGMTGAFNTQNFDLNDYVTTGSTGNFVTRNETGQLGNLILSQINFNLNQEYFSKQNDSYACSIAARKTTSNATPTYLEYNNSTSLVSLDAGDNLTFTATINAIGCNVSSYAYFKIEGSARRYMFLNGGLTTTCSILNNEPSVEIYSSSSSQYDAVAEIDNLSNSLKIKVIGDSSHQQQWFAKIDVTKNNFAIDSQIILPETLYFSGNSSNYNWFNCNNWYTNTQLTNRSLSFAQTGNKVIVCGNKGPFIDLTCNLWNTPVLINALNLTDASGVCFYSPLNQPAGFSGIVSGVASFFGGAYLI